MDDVIKWKHFPRYWPVVLGIHRSPVNSPHKGQWRGVLIFPLICVWTKYWLNNRDVDDLICYRVHYDVNAMWWMTGAMFRFEILSVATGAERHDFRSFGATRKSVLFAVFCSIVLWIHHTEVISYLPLKSTQAMRSKDVTTWLDNNLLSCCLNILNVFENGCYLFQYWSAVRTHDHDIFTWHLSVLKSQHNV